MKIRAFLLPVILHRHAMTRPAAFLLPLLLFAVAATAHAQTNLLTNGSFETGPYYTNGTVTGWTVAGPVDVETFPVADGTYAANMHIGGTNGIATADLFQSFPTTLGAPYHLSISVAVFGSFTNQPLLYVNVTGGSTLVGGTVSPPTYHLAGASYVSNGYGTFTYDFTANSSQATLLINNGTSTAFTDSGSLAVDAVSVTQVPEPSTFAWLALGLVAGGLSAKPRTSRRAGWFNAATAG